MMHECNSNFRDAGPNAVLEASPVAGSRLASHHPGARITKSFALIYIENYLQINGATSVLGCHLPGLSIFIKSAFTNTLSPF